MNDEASMQKRLPIINGVRWHRTGDLARRVVPKTNSPLDRDHLDLEILGRCAFMVKIRGYSVVPEQIENAIENRLACHQCVVLADGEEGTDKRLVAYLVPCAASARKTRMDLTTKGLVDSQGQSPVIYRALLQDLPHYAVPSCYVLLESMPIAGASVKADRKALPKPPSPPKVAEMPKADEKWFDGSLDSCLLLFEIVLDLPFDTLAADSNFFEFGGYSLKATKLMGLIKKHTKGDYLLDKDEEVKLKIPSIAEFLLAPTPLQLSEIIVGGPEKARRVQQVAISSSTKSGNGQVRTRSRPGDGADDGSWVMVGKRPPRDLPSEVEAFSYVTTPATRSVASQVFCTGVSNTILLTGATGYVGSNLLRQLLRGTPNTEKNHQRATTVVCLSRVPAKNQEEFSPEDPFGTEQVIENAGLERLKDSCMKHGVTDITQEEWDKVRVFAGDVAQDKLGLAEADYQFLSGAIDVVVHSAAFVNLAFPYEVLVHANVLGTANVIDFARAGKVKPIHYISSNGIFPEEGPVSTETVFKETDTPPHELLKTGYGQTKWVAEQLIYRAFEQGLLGGVYRLGNVGGPLGVSKNGSQAVLPTGWNASDSNLLFLKACLSRGAVPASEQQTEQWKMEFTPVDFIAEFVTNCVFDLRFANCKTFHLINPSTLPLSMIHTIFEKLGYKLQRQNVQTWCASSSSGEEALSVADELILTETSLKQLLVRLHLYGHENTNMACDRFGMKYPELDARYCHATMKRLIAEKLLPAPPQVESGLPGKLLGKTAIVTGASSGIGLAIATALAKESCRVVLVSRSKTKLEDALEKLLISTSSAGSDTAGMEHTFFPCDVSKRQNVEQMVKWVEDGCGTGRKSAIDILINAAGVMYFTLMKNSHEEEWEQTVDINCKGVVNCCGSVIKRMLPSKSGHIVNISSDASRTVFPALAVYNASKAFVTTFSKGLRCELVGTGLRVTDIQPGDTRTNLIKNNTDQEAADKVGVKIKEVIGAGVEDGDPNFLDAADIADAVLYAVTAPKNVGLHEILIEPRDQMYGDPTAMG
jgi:thioester reductase-like protein